MPASFVHEYMWKRLRVLQHLALSPSEEVPRLIPQRLSVSTRAPPLPPLLSPSLLRLASSRPSFTVFRVGVYVYLSYFGTRTRKLPHRARGEGGPLGPPPQPASPLSVPWPSSPGGGALKQNEIVQEIGVLKDNDYEKERRGRGRGRAEPRRVPEDGEGDRRHIAEQLKPLPAPRGPPSKIRK